MRTVLVGGTVVKHEGALVGVDVARVLEHAERSAERILARVRVVTPSLPPRAPAGVDFDAIARANLAAARR